VRSPRPPSGCGDIAQGSPRGTTAFNSLSNKEKPFLARALRGDESLAEELAVMEQTEKKRLFHLGVGAAVALVIVSLVGISAISGRSPLVGSRAQQEGPEAAAKQLEAARPNTQQSERDAGAQVCDTCGTVESVRAHVVRSEGSASGSSARGVVGREQTVHRVTIRMDDGSYRTISQPVEPGYSVGEKVRIIDGSVVARE
jgi:outer membrane lipoprotein SlyB